MRILSDFDGVWTDQAHEARSIFESLARSAATHIGGSPEAALAEADGFLRAAHAAPGDNGWWPRGLLSAFVDEDTLLATGSVARWLDDGGDLPGADRWRDGIRAAGFESVEGFSADHFVPAMNCFRAEHGHRLVPGARATVEKLLSRGVELVIVSNSPREKLVEMFAAEGLGETDNLRFVGSAMKWWIEDEARVREVQGRRVYLDRPHYREIVEREAPDLVIGDVASFDLSVPADLRTRGALDPATRLVLRSNDDSSPWALAQPGLPRDVRLVDSVIPGVADLERLLFQGARTSR